MDNYETLLKYQRELYQALSELNNEIRRADDLLRDMEEQKIQNERIS